MDTAEPNRHLKPRETLCFTFFKAEKHKVLQGYSPADEGAGSLTPFRMTLDEKTSARYLSSSVSHIGPLPI
jgi:hypothetical protein